MRYGRNVDDINMRLQAEKSGNWGLVGKVSLIYKQIFAICLGNKENNPA